MCNCKQEVEKKLIEKYKDEPGDNHEIHLKGYGFMMGKDNVLQHRPIMPMEHTYIHTFKNGNKKKKTDKISMALSHCPFCGVKVIPD